MMNYTLDYPSDILPGVDSELPIYEWQGISFQCAYFDDSDDGDTTIYIDVNADDFHYYFGVATPIAEAGQILNDQLVTDGLPECLFQKGNADWAEQMEEMF